MIPIETLSSNRVKPRFDMWRNYRTGEMKKKRPSSFMSSVLDFVNSTLEAARYRACAARGLPRRFDVIRSGGFKVRPLF